MTCTRCTKNTNIKACWSFRPPCGILAMVRGEGLGLGVSVVAASLCREGRVKMRATRKWNMSMSSRHSVSNIRDSTFSGINTVKRKHDSCQINIDEQLYATFHTSNQPECNVPFKRKSPYIHDDGRKLVLAFQVGNSSEMIIGNEFMVVCKPLRDRVN